MSVVAKIACLAILTMLGPLSSGSAAAQDRPAVSTIRVRAGEVVVDASITDRGGKPVRGLIRNDFEVYEDGVKQQIESFRSVTSGAPTAGVIPAARNPDRLKTGTEAEREAKTFPRLVSIVIDKINTERGDAMRAAAAARAYAEKVFAEGDLAAVYSIGAGVHVYQSFTRSRERLVKGIQAATAANAGVPGDVAEEIRTALQSIPTGMIPGVASDADKIALAYSDGSTTWSLENPLAEILTELRTLLIFQEYDRQIRSDRSLAGLLSIINSQKVIPARKCMIFISGGFTIPAGGQGFRAVVNAANRAGVTIYPVDASGLRGTDPDEERRALEEAAAKTRNYVGLRTPLGLREIASGLNPLESLDRLAEGTGGYTVKNTNDLAGGVERLGAYLGEYYVLTYTPANLIPDGRFRNISVKVKKGGVNVRARNGYFAFPDTERLPVLGYEVELLENLNTKSPPARFPVFVEGLQFPGNGGASTSALFVQFPLSELKVEKNSAAGSYTVQAEVLLLVRGRDGGVLQRMSRQYDMEGSVEMMESTLKKSFSFCRRTSLPPGDYGLEAVVRDRRGGKISVKKAEFRVEAYPRSGVRLGSIVLCKDSALSAIQDSQDASAGIRPLDDPLQTAGAPVVPDFSRRFSASMEREFGLFLVVRPRDVEAPMKATFDFVREGASAFRVEQSLRPPDANGEARHLALVDLAPLKPGMYELRVTVVSGPESASSTTTVVVVN